MNNQLIVLVEGKNDVKADDRGINSKKLGIGSINVNGPRVAKDIKVDIITTKFKTPILFGFYLNIAILSKFIIYQLQ